jgi:hypothetical protein
MAQTKQARSSNKGRLHTTFNVGELVLLKADEIGTVVDRKRRLNKLDERYLGPFEIIQVVSPTAYKLKLPDTLKIHPVFHVSLLERYLLPDKEFGQEYSEIPLPEFKDDVPYYQLEKILKHRRRKGELEYLIKWKDYPLSESTWEPARVIEEDAPDHVREYELCCRDLGGECDVTAVTVRYA